MNGCANFEPVCFHYIFFVPGPDCSSLKDQVEEDIRAGKILADWSVEIAQILKAENLSATIIEHILPASEVSCVSHCESSDPASYSHWDILGWRQVFPSSENGNIVNDLERCVDAKRLAHERIGGWPHVHLVSDVEVPRIQNDSPRDGRILSSRKFQLHGISAKQCGRVLLLPFSG